ncbi:MAG: phosphoenolpyruvate--protein phosphotransferase [Micrococcales bacterium]|nr:phosphoenolpyruvate--protein phosphotransferase [Micrococcales bacterium]
MRRGSEPVPGALLAPGTDPAVAVERLQGAAEAVACKLEQIACESEGSASEVLEATALIARDPSLLTAAGDLVMCENLSPDRAIWEACEGVASQFEAIGGLMAERVTDVRDVRDRIIAHVTGQGDVGIPERPEPFILVATDLAPADTARLDPAWILGIVTRDGGATSHTAIVARERGIPAVLGLAEAEEITDGVDLLIDGTKGTVVIGPTKAQVRDAEAKAKARAARSFSGKGHTADGHRIKLLANIGDARGAEAAAAGGAEGVGLFRTEVAFLGRTDAPTVNEQAREYRRVIEIFEGKTVTIRTLDAGADKPLPFLHMPPEENPALGVRGLRIAELHPTILDDQLAAIAMACDGVDTEVRVMAPLVASVGDAARFKDACTRHGIDESGVMVEVPSAAIMAKEILAVASFASIGTNDLTQYVMAADRMNAPLAKYIDAFHPAVLRMVAQVCQGGAANGRPVGVCGESAANPALAVVFAGLGIASLSMAVVSLPDVAHVLASTTMEQCRRLAHAALDCATADEARRIVTEGLPVLADLD